MMFRTGGNATRLQITSDGKLLINSSTVTASYGGNLQVTNTNVAINSFADNPHAQTFMFAKSRGTSGSGGTILQNNDFCGHIEWYADDGVDTQNQVAKISARIDGTPNTNVTPGELLFYTTPDNANASTERFAILKNGTITCGHGGNINLHQSTTTGICLNGNGNSGQIIANASGNRALIIGRQASYGQVIEFFQGTNGNEAGITIPAADTLGLETNGNERLRLKGDGIIEMGSSIGASSDANIRLRLGRSSDCYLGIRATGNDTAETGIKFGDASSEHDGKFAYLHTSQRFRITVAGNDRIFIDGAGDIFGQTSNSNIVGFMGAKTTSGTTNWNHSTNARSGNGFTLLLGTHSNGPGPSLYYHPFTFEYAQRDSNGNMTQLAIPYNGGAIYSRYRYSGSWSGWTSH